MAFDALIVHRTGDGSVEPRIETLDETALMPGNVLVRVEWSTVNYKDGLAVTGAAPIIQRFPLIAGIDFAGTVETSDDPRFQPGDRVVANGWGLSQTHHGGYGGRARVNGDWLIALPDTISPRDAMAIGTAGYTAMLCVLALEQGGLVPDRGNVLVTGANGGVGSVAIALLAKLGHRVIASTGRMEDTDYLRGLGAAEIIDRGVLSGEGKPIGRECWVGAVDTVGSHTLANVLAQTAYDGVVAACGLAQGADLPASVLPFILRGVTLAGIDSVNAPRERRERAWQRLACDLDLATLARTVTEVSLADVPQVARAILQGKVRGRTVVRIGS